MQVADCTDAVEAVFEGGEGAGLREQHEEAVEAFVEVRETLGFEELEAEVWGSWSDYAQQTGVKGRLAGEDGGL